MFVTLAMKEEKRVALKVVAHLAKKSTGLGDNQGARLVTTLAKSYTINTETRGPFATTICKQSQ